MSSVFPLAASLRPGLMSAAALILGLLLLRPARR
jgi:hypothetical protein